jgi:hypothetical protein
MCLDCLIFAASPASGVNHQKCGKRRSTVEPRIVDHAWGRTVTAGLGAAPAGRVGLVGNLGAGHSPVAEVHDRLVKSAAAAANNEHALRRNG